MLNWVKRYCKNSSNWQAVPLLIIDKLKDVTMEEFFHYNINYTTYIENYYTYFYELCRTQQSIKCKPITSQAILDEKIWYNKKLLIDKKHFLWPKWREKGINKLIDIFSLDGTTKNLYSIQNEFNIVLDSLNWNQLLSCIPKEQKRILKNDPNKINFEEQEKKSAQYNIKRQ